MLGGLKREGENEETQNRSQRNKKVKKSASMMSSFERQRLAKLQLGILSPLGTFFPGLLG
jgi:hypothetical protein